jgi:hypothetical protein
MPGQSLVVGAAAVHPDATVEARDRRAPALFQRGYSEHRAVVARRRPPLASAVGPTRSVVMTHGMRHQSYQDQLSLN